MCCVCIVLSLPPSQLCRTLCHVLCVYSSLPPSQLCRTLCHVLCVAKEEDMAALPPHPLSVAATACLTDCCYSVSDHHSYLHCVYTCTTISNIPSPHTLTHSLTHSLTSRHPKQMVSAVLPCVCMCVCVCVCVCVYCCMLCCRDGHGGG